MRGSTPEATALDLVRFYERVGDLSHVATVLGELAEKIDASKLVIAAAEAEGESAVAQRFGYLLERMGASKAATKLSRWVDRRSPKPVLLTSDNPGQEIASDARWRVIVNDKVEPEDILDKGTK